MSALGIYCADCGTECERTAGREAGRFRASHRHSRATEIVRGQRLSPATEFKPGQPAHNKLPVGSVTIRMRNGAARAFVKIAEPSKWRERALVVFEAAHGPVPKGRVVHHRDRNPMNDDLENLVALTRAEHALEHAAEVQAAGFGSEEARRRALAARFDQ